MDAISLSVLGICLGHPQINACNVTQRFANELEELDNAFDDLAYEYGWRPWEWEPKLCVNCCSKRVSRTPGGYLECEICGWLQGE